MTEAERKEKMNELMNRISFVLKDATLAQGFEIICERIRKFEKKNEEMKNLIEIQYQENQTLGNNNAKLLNMFGELKAQIEEMKCCENCKFWQNNDCVVEHDYDCKRWNNTNTDDYWEMVE